MVNTLDSPLHRKRFSLERQIVQDTTLLAFLHSASSLSKTELKRAMIAGAVWLRRRGSRKLKRTRTATLQLRAGDFVALYYDYSLLRRKSASPTCLAKHRSFSVWYKPSGMLSQGTKYGDHLSLMRAVSTSLGGSTAVYLVHRLDREASGILVLAHTKQGSAALSKQFRENAVIKRYWAVVDGKFTLPRTPYEITLELDGKACRTVITSGRYRHGKDRTEITIELKTGRYHQIRRHLAAIGHPVVGDFRYGTRTRCTTPLQLCAYELCFEDPSAKEMQRYRLPSDLLPPSLRENDNRSSP